MRRGERGSEKRLGLVSDMVCVSRMCLGFVTDRICDVCCPCAPPTF